MDIDEEIRAMFIDMGMVPENGLSRTRTSGLCGGMNFLIMEFQYEGKWIDG
jgi:hypothetical protein